MQRGFDYIARHHCLHASARLLRNQLTFVAVGYPVVASSESST
jgi:hypothetical protein